MSDPRVSRTERGAVLFDAERLDGAPEQWFDRTHWEESGAVLDLALGRGTVLVVSRGSESWVLRHYRRGGVVARFVEDHYLWLGLERTRAFREWRLLLELLGRGLPVPRPVAARVVRSGLVYQADIITAYLARARTLSTYIAEGTPSGERWRSIGRTLRRFHDHGVEHPDLTAHNILLDPEGSVFLVDFDNARLRRPGRWREAGIARLKRSLRKVALETGTPFSEEAWRALGAGYAEQPRARAT
jgi:3-deoxy-D-manno-octulosonic acid kinase